MNKMQSCSTPPAFGSAQKMLAAALLGATLGISAQAQNMYDPPAATPGGVRAQSQITSFSTVGTNTTLCWYGMQGWYGVEMSTNNAPPWTTLGTTAASDFGWCLTVPNGGSTNAFFRLNQNNAFVGSGACAGCHGDKFNDWKTTGHSTAYSLIANLPDATRQNCVVCHTVGYGQPTGFVSTTNTPQLMDVGCETCHGPAAWHKYSDHNLVRPAVTVAAEICGGCHDGDHHPTYTEFTNSPHAEFLADVGAGVNDSFSGQSRMVQCGACHSAAARLAMLSNYENQMAGITNYLKMPTTHDETNYGITCVVCHDPHTAAGYVTTNIVTTTNGFVTNIVMAPYQLRYPMRSTNYYTYFTATPTVVTARTNFAGVVTYTTNYVNAAFASQYNQNVQVCAQCHNGRGARWDGIGRIWNGTNLVPGTASWSRPPHPADQYNVLIGIIQPDYLNTNSSGVATNYIARHGVGVSGSGVFNTNQCATCHVPIYTTTNIVGSATNILYTTGHSFDMDTRGCTVTGCHGSVPNYLSTQATTTNSISRVLSLLNQWALAKGTSLFGAVNAAKYKQNGWEFTTPGALASITNAGPSSTDQPKLPDAIKQARFNVYMVYGDGSLGVHNPNYVPFLLSDAENKVLSQFTLANFKAYTTAGFAPLSVGFTNLGTGVTGYSWSFGDGNTSTLAAPTNVYATGGTYAVTLTATGASGSETLVRTNYITVSTRPVVTFTASPRSGKAPLTVNFTNTSTSTNSVTAWRWTINGQNISTTDAVYTFTNVYTTNISYNIVLRATTPAGNITTTSNAFITVTAP